MNGGEQTETLKLREQNKELWGLLARALYATDAGIELELNNDVIKAAREDKSGNATRALAVEGITLPANGEKWLDFGYK
jgi:hypothetical protein